MPFTFHLKSLTMRASGGVNPLYPPPCVRTIRGGGAVEFLFVKDCLLIFIIDELFP